MENVPIQLAFLRFVACRMCYVITFAHYVTLLGTIIEIIENSFITREAMHLRNNVTLRRIRATIFAAEKQ
jgi:hypothetical protein